MKRFLPFRRVRTEQECLLRHKSWQSCCRYQRSRCLTAQGVSGYRTAQKRLELKAAEQAEADLSHASHRLLPHHPVNCLKQNAEGKHGSAVNSIPADKRAAFGNAQRKQQRGRRCANNQHHKPENTAESESFAARSAKRDLCRCLVSALTERF